MTTPRQYVACKFKPWDQRTYTYHNDGEPVAPGDEVVVETKDGRKVITVESIIDGPPTFETKPIIGLAPSAEDAPASA